MTVTAASPCPEFLGNRGARRRVAGPAEFLGDDFPTRALALRREMVRLPDEQVVVLVDVGQRNDFGRLPNRPCSGCSLPVATIVKGAPFLSFFGGGRGWGGGGVGVIGGRRGVAGRLQPRPGQAEAVGVPELVAGAAGVQIGPLLMALARSASNMVHTRAHRPSGYSVRCLECRWRASSTHWPAPAGVKFFRAIRNWLTRNSSMGAS